MDKQYYTAGEIARIAGVSLRTIRHYDTKGLLPPVSHSDTGYRYYDKSSLALLQRIMMLKYLGFSLEQIQHLIAAQEAHALDQEAILAQQKSLLLEKKKHLELLVSTGTAQRPGGQVAGAGTLPEFADQRRESSGAISESRKSKPPDQYPQLFHQFPGLDGMGI